MNTQFNKKTTNYKRVCYNSILFLFSCILFSCSTEVSKKSFSNKSEIIGLASPIKLGFDSTTLVLEDYFLNPDAIDSIQLSKELKYWKEENIKVIGSSQNAMSNARFSLGEFTYDIPVIRSKREKFHFEFKDENHQHKSVCLAGSVNGWVASKDSLIFENGTWSTDFILSPGKYQYRLHIDGVEMLDPTNSDSIDNGLGGYNSIFSIGSTDLSPRIRTLENNGNSISIIGNKAYTDYLIYWENHLLNTQYMEQKGDTLTVQIPAEASSKSRSFLRIWATNTNSYSNDLLIPIGNGKALDSGNQLTRKDKEGYIMYFMMVDRFFNGNTSNDAKVENNEIQPIANYFGGDIAGITAKIKSGYFEQLGVNTIWLSPIVQNPTGAWGLWDKAGKRSKFSGYHGYWPISSTAIDTRFGTDEELDKLIETAHQQNTNVLLDYVANHVHQEHPVIQKHPNWKTDLYLPDGTMNTEKWDEHRLTTWFDTFLPTLDLENDTVTDAMSDSAVYWFDRFDIDGFRHDATKHVPEIYWRTLNRKLKTQILAKSDRSIYQIGETYGSPELIGSYISSGMLDAQFDFNLYDAAVASFARPDISFERLQGTLQETMDNYGYHNLMGNISGNQDRTRFISYADSSVAFDEDPKLAGWSRTISNQSKSGFDKLAMLNAFNLTVPGIPVIYYGDEIGLPGANDPDNRRMMIFDSLNSDQAELKAAIEQLTKLRKQNLCFTYGDTEILKATHSLLLFKRSYFDQVAYVLFNGSSETQVHNLSCDPNHTWIDINQQTYTPENGAITIQLKPNSYNIIMTK